MIPHPENLNYPPRYKFSVFCGPLASLADSQKNCMPSNSPSIATSGLSYRTGLQMSGRPQSTPYIIWINNFELFSENFLFTRKNSYQNFWNSDFKIILFGTKNVLQNRKFPPRLSGDLLCFWMWDNAVQ